MKLYEALAGASTFPRAIVKNDHPNMVLTVYNNRLLITHFDGDVNNCDYDNWHLANTPTLDELNEDGYDIHCFFHGFDEHFYKNAIAFSIKSALQKALILAERIEFAPTEMMISKVLNKIIKEVSDANALTENALCLLTGKGDFKPVSLMIEECKAYNKAMKKSRTKKD